MKLQRNTNLFCLKALSLSPRLLQRWWRVYVWVKCFQLGVKQNQSINQIINQSINQSICMQWAFNRTTWHIALFWQVLSCTLRLTYCTDITGHFLYVETDIMHWYDGSLPVCGDWHIALIWRVTSRMWRLDIHVLHWFDVSFLVCEVWRIALIWQVTSFLWRLTYCTDMKGHFLFVTSDELH